MWGQATPAAGVTIRSAPNFRVYAVSTSGTPSVDIYQVNTDGTTTKLGSQKKHTSSSNASTVRRTMTTC